MTLEAIATSRGHLSNLMQTLALAPQGLRAFAELGEYCRFGTFLTEKQRELTIVIGLRNVPYGWDTHAPLAQAAGVTEEQLLLIRDGRIPRSLAPDEIALCDYAFEVTAGRRIPQRVAEELHEHFNARQIIDIALLTAYYGAVAALAIGLEVPANPPETLAAELERQRDRLPPPPPEEEDTAAEDEAF